MVNKKQRVIFLEKTAESVFISGLAFYGYLHNILLHVPLPSKLPCFKELEELGIVDHIL